MNAIEVIVLAKKSGVHLYLKEGSLAFKASKGALTDELKSLIKLHKEDILALLNQKSEKRIDIPVRETDVKVPLTKTQQRMFFMSELNPDSYSYNICIGLELFGDISIPKFESSIKKVIGRYSVLNSTVNVENDIPYLKYNASLAPHIDVDVYSEEHGATKEDVKRTLFYKNYNRHINLKNGPTIFCHFYSYKPNETLFFFTAHHLFMDGLSFDLLTTEILSEYLGLTKEKVNSNDISFEDFAVWQANSTQDNLEQENYWLNRLKNAPSAHSIQLDRARKTGNKGKGSFYKPQLSKNLTNALKSLAGSLDVSLFSLLHTSFSLIIAMWSRENDVITGVPVSGRTHRQLQSVIGMLANTLVYRAEFDFDKPFSETVKLQHQHHIDALTNQSVPLDRLIELINPPRIEGQSPIFQLFFNLVSLNELSVPDGAFSYSHIDLDSFEVDSKFDLSLNILDQEPLSFCWDFDCSIFELDTVEAIHNGLISLLESVLENPDKKISNIKLVSVDNKKDSLAKGAPVMELFQQQCNANSHSTAIIHNDIETSYDELHEKVSNLTDAILKQNVDGPIGIIGHRNVDFIVAILACLASGRSYVPIDDSMPIKRREMILSHADIKAVINCSTQTLNGELLSIIAETSSKTDELVLRQHGETPAYIIYTSGSTGHPKGVAISYENLSHFLQSMTSKIEFGAEDSMVSLTTPSFDISLVELLLPLISGGKVILLDSKYSSDGSALAELVNNYQPTFIQATPATWQLLLNENNIKLERTSVLTGGEALPKALGISLVQKSSRVFNCYGPTEATVWSMVNEIQLQDLDEKEPLIGGTLNGYDHLVVDQFNNVLPVGAVGELIIGGAGVGMGYWQEDNKTEDVFRTDIIDGQRWYKTGDLVRQVSPDKYQYLGRNDQQVKVRGFRIELAEIEYQLQNILGHNVACAVDAKPSLLGGYELVGYVVSDAIKFDEIEDELSQLLPQYMVPKRWLSVDEIPLNSNGKVDRKSLPNVNVQNKETTPIKSATEQLVHQVWTELLINENIGAEDNFFSLGGNSLIINKMLSGIKEKTGKQLTLAQVFKTPTIRQLSLVIDAQKESHSLTKRSNENEGLLSSSQLRILLSESIGEAGSNHIPMALKISGKLDIDKLKQALELVVNKHAILRTYFTEGADGVHQKIADRNQMELPFAVTVTDGQDVSETHLQERYKQFIEVPFSFKHAGLFRIELVVISDTEFALFSVFHHMVFDGWSFGVFLNDMLSGYAQLSNDQTADIGQNVFDYLDFSIWQQDWLSSNKSAEQKRFWQSYLESAPRETRISADKKINDVASTPARFKLSLPTELLTSLKHVSKQLDTNLFNMLYSTFNFLVSRVTDQDTVVTGTPVSGRELSETQDMIGMFVNNLAVKVVVNESESVRQYISKHMDNLSEVFEHQMLPLESVIEIINPPRDTGSTPLFQLFFNMLNLPEPTTDLKNLTLKPLFAEDIGAKFDITVYVSELENGLEMFLIYNSQRYSSSRIEDFMSQYLHLLGEFCKHLDKPLIDIQLPTSAIDKYIESGWQGSVIKRFERHVDSSPNQLALVSETSKITYAELQTKIESLASYLQKTLSNEATVVAICIERTSEAVAAVLSVLKAGFAFTLIDIQQGSNKVQRQLDKIKPSLILTFLNTPKSDVFSRTDTYQLGAIESWNWEHQLVDVPLQHESLACVTYTSGSTGENKAVLGCHGGISNYLSWFVEQYDVGVKDRVSMLSGITHDPIQRDIFEALCTGATLVIPNENQIKPDTLSDWIIKNQITVTHITPSLSLLIEPKLERAFSMRHVFFFGELLTSKCVDRMRSIIPTCRFHNVYGATETQRGVTYTECFEDTEPSDITMETVDTMIRIHDKDGNECVYGQQGELIIWSNNISLGYFDASPSDDSRFISDSHGNRGYKTGDRGVVIAGDKINLKGRLDRQIKLRGYRIELAEIESHISSAKTVKQAAVKFVKTDTEGYLAAYIAVQDSHFDMNELKRHIRKQMPVYMIPTHWQVMPQLPLNGSGKVDYLSLEGATLAGSEAIVPAETSTQSLLIDIWLKFLSVDNVGIDNNFFEAGGHSLDAAKMLAEIKSKMGIDASLRQVFENPTIRELSFLLESLEAKALSQSFEQINAEVIEL